MEKGETMKSESTKDLAHLISKLNPRIVQIREEGSFLPVDIAYSQAAYPVEEDCAQEISGDYESLIFVDSRRRTYESILVEGFVMLFAQIVTGALAFSKGLCVPLFSPGEKPEINFILAVPESLANRYGLFDGEMVIVGEIAATVAVGSTAERALDSYMQKVERRVVEKHLSDALVVKDGSIDFTTPAFQPKVGPVGLVKNIETAYVDMESFLSYGFMKAGERSKSIKIRLSEPNYERVMSYLKLTNSPGLSGLVRLEVVVETEEYNQVRSQIFDCFNMLAKTLPNLTADAPFIPRMPENIFPVSYLEKCLDKFFYDRNYVHWNLRKALAFSKP